MFKYSNKRKSFFTIYFAVHHLKITLNGFATAIFRGSNNVVLVMLLTTTSSLSVKFQPYVIGHKSNECVLINFVFYLVHSSQLARCSLSVSQLEVHIEAQYL